MSEAPLVYANFTEERDCELTTFSVYGCGESANPNLKRESSRVPGIMLGRMSGLTTAQRSRQRPRNWTLGVLAPLTTCKLCEVPVP
jgi:hypothetical protein